MRILLADDQVQLRSALRLLLENEAGVSVVGEAVGADDLLAQVTALCPDLVLLDWELPGLRPTDLLPSLLDACPNLVVIALSGLPESRAAALAFGVDAFVSKGDPPERLLATLRDLISIG